MRLSHWITITFFSWFQFQFNFTNTDTKHTFGLLHSWFLRRSWPGRLDNPQMMRSTSCPESAGDNKTGRSLCSLILYKFAFKPWFCCNSYQHFRLANIGHKLWKIVEYFRSTSAMPSSSVTFHLQYFGQFPNNRTAQLSQFSDHLPQWQKKSGYLQKFLFSACQQVLNYGMETQQKKY